ncbi:MAG: trypsin-like peptidase domain-containing protein [Azospira sp.]|jgi:hypothetical protein
MPEPLFFQRTMLSHKAVMVHCLDDNGNEIEGAYASGFLLKEKGELFLYTCWHVVTGFDIHQLPMDYKAPNRRQLRISLQNAAEQPSGGAVRAFFVHGLRTFDVALYKSVDGKDVPLWHQDVMDRSADLESVKVVVPNRYDAIRIPLPEFDISPMHIVEEANLNHSLIFPGDRIYIVGFPHKFSTRGEDQPIPVVLTRFVAGTQIKDRIGEFLLDGVGAPGMSGGPAFVERDGQLELAGIFKGTIYTAGEANKHKDIGALGACVDMSICWTHEIASLRPLYG